MLLAREDCLTHTILGFKCMLLNERLALGLYRGTLATSSKIVCEVSQTFLALRDKCDCTTGLLRLLTLLVRLVALMRDKVLAKKSCIFTVFLIR